MKLLTATAIAFCAAMNSAAAEDSLVNEYGMKPAAMEAITIAIRAAGFYCPQVKVGWYQGIDVYGEVSKFKCGPAGGDAVLDELVFRITIQRDDKRTIIEPWHD